MLDVLLKGLLLGFSTGGYCVAVCTPVILPYIVSNGWQTPKVSFRIVLEFLSGRFIAYLLFGIIVVLFGKQVQASVFWNNLIAFLIIVLAILLLLQGFLVNFSELRICVVLKQSRILKRFPFLAGFILGINLCPPFMIAFTYLSTVGNIFLGSMFSMSFFTGTVVFIIPLFFSGYIGKLQILREMSKVAIFFSGLWFLIYGVNLIFKLTIFGFF